MPSAAATTRHPTTSGDPSSPAGPREDPLWWNQICFVLRDHLSLDKKHKWKPQSSLIQVLLRLEEENGLNPADEIVGAHHLYGLVRERVYLVPAEFAIVRATR